MKMLMAEAYQRSLGRTGDKVATGEKALNELTDAMKKSQVKTAKIFPLLIELLQREAEKGLDEARQGPEAQRNRFLNKIEGFWEKFTMYGGKGGVGSFWIEMQRFGDWIEARGPVLGAYFEAMVAWIRVFTEAASQAVDFMKTGKENELSEIVKGWGIDVSAARNTIVGIFTELKTMFLGITDSTGFSKDGKFGESLKDKIVTFTNNLLSILESIHKFLFHINQAIDSFSDFSKLPWYRKPVALIPFTEESKMLGKGLAHSGTALYHSGSVTAKAVGTVGDVFFGDNKSKPVIPYTYGNTLDPELQTVLEQNLGLPSYSYLKRTGKLSWQTSISSPSLDPSIPPTDRALLHKDTLEATLAKKNEELRLRTIELNKRYRPSTASPTNIFPQAAASAVVQQHQQNMGGNTPSNFVVPEFFTMKPPAQDVNVKITVDGNPEAIRLMVGEEAVSAIRKEVTSAAVQAVQLR